MLKRTLLSGAMGVALAAALLAGCNKPADPVTQAAKKDAAAGVPAPGIAEVKAIAEEGLIYGLPIVMNYAVMYEYVIDKHSGQFKAPFNQIHNEARVFTYEDTAIITPNSDTPYSLLWMDLRAEPLVLSVPAVDKNRYYSVMLNDGNTFNYGYIGSRATGNDAGDYMVVGPNWKGETPAGIKKVFRSTTDFSLAAYRTQLIDHKDMPNRDREKPHGSPLPHHRADGSRTRRFGRLSRQVESPSAEAAQGFAARKPEPHLYPLQAHVHPVGCSHGLHWTTITPLFQVPRGTPFGPSVGSLAPRRRLPYYALC